MSDPQIVDAIENNFVPVCIYNNTGGKDGRVVAEFKEPTWNYPVTRIINQQKKDLVARNKNWRNRSGVIQQIAAGIKARGSVVPGYVELLALTDNAKQTKYETAVFGMS